MPNRLANESSPYLLQHKDNPVDWYPWGREALQKARTEDKPVFLSIGYSTCHWCHVMERESFEDEDVARLMNAAFVAIKVDREERPDIDNIYMSVCQLVGGSCGWPLNVVMTPGGEPFFVGTYFPKQERGGRIGMTELIPRLSEAWQNDRKRIEESADNIVSALSKMSEASSGTVDPDWIQIAETQLLRSHDRINGGFGSKPKFPSPHNVLFLIRGSQKLSDDVTSTVTTTLDRMATGGFHDHVGGGFHRYSTDAEWRLPHFEKMLYDQAMLLLAYTEGWRRTGYARYQQIAERIAAYVRRDLMMEDGSFYAAEDADSEGVEGKFYVWTHEDVVRLTSIEFADRFDVHPDGNFEDEATGRYTGENVLHMTRPSLAFSPDEPLYSGSTMSNLHDLLTARESRVRPGLDTKVLVDWNGLMIAALARAGRVFGNPLMADMASNAAYSILSGLSDKGELHHLHSSSKRIPGMLDDYAFLCFATIELYQTTHRSEWLRYALDLGEAMNRLFADPESGRLFLAPEEGADLIIRPIDLNDGAIPSGNAIAAACYQRLHWLTGNSLWFDRAEMIVQSAANSISRYPSAFTAMLLAVHGFGRGGREIVISGRLDDDLVVAAFAKLRQTSSDETVSHYLNSSDSEEVNRLTDMVEYLKPMAGQLDKTAVYVCDDFSCSLPVTSIDSLPATL